ncbi:hypothetical protein Tco_1395063 [Tanacetum coccineum]
MDEEDWGSDEDDLILSNDDERTETGKDTIESDKTDENSNDEEECVKDEYVHDADNVHDVVEKHDDMADASQANVEKIDKEKGDTEHAVNDQAAKDAQVKDDHQETTTIPAIQKENPDVPPSSSSLSISLDYEITTVQSPTLLVVPVSVIPEQTIQTPTLTLQVPIVDHFEVIAEVVKTNVINEFKNQLPKLLPKGVSDFVILGIKSKVHEVLKEHTEKPFDQAAKAEYDQKEILFKMMRDSKSHEKHPTYKALYDALMLSLVLDEDDIERAKATEPPTQKKRRHDDKDQDPPAGSDQGMKKSKKSKDVEPSKNTKKYGSSKDKSTWFKQPLRSPTLDPEWNKGKSIEDEPVQNWLNDLANAEKPSLTFDDLMSTPIDFHAFAMNRPKISKLTKADLVGLVYNLLKGTCKSCVELKYNIEECYRTLSDQLDRNNLQGD